MTNMESESGPTTVLERLRRAIDGHDLDALAAGFDPDYHSEFPVHPDRHARHDHPGVRHGRISWVRLYMEPVQEGAGVDPGVRQSLAGR